MPTDVMTVDQLTRWIRKARHVERQIRWRYELRQFLQNATRKKVRTNNAFFNALSWFFSYPVLEGLSGYLLRFAIKSGAFIVRAARRLKK